MRIEALPPEIYAEFLAWEQGRAAERRARLKLPRTPWVPAAEDLPEIYRSPLSLPELPAEIASSLEQSGCLIPQGLSGHSNVVVGQFATAGQQAAIKFDSHHYLPKFSDDLNRVMIKLAEERFTGLRRAERQAR
jgi:hypothetical protein